jgi:hypothetical protein
MTASNDSLRQPCLSPVNSKHDHCLSPSVLVLGSNRHSQLVDAGFKARLSVYVLARPMQLAQPLACHRKC